MIGMQSCISAVQALTIARAVERSGGEPFSVTQADGEWSVWFRFDDPRQADAISGHFLRLWKEEQKFQRRQTAPRTVSNRKLAAKRARKNPSS